MAWSLIILRRLVNVQKNTGSGLNQRVTFELAVPVAFIFEVSKRLAFLIQDIVSHLLRVQQTLLEIRQMLTNVKEERIHLRFLRVAF